ncbi:MAG: hypothetical protein D6725_15755 [Planctomycetota bacterium]|nr:MAG: hypothetical protein D6725_15755 [Planctomycetota bacterium]
MRGFPRRSNPRLFDTVTAIVRLLAVWAAISSASDPCRAAGLTAELNGLTPYLRSGGPVVLDWTLIWDEGTVWTGVVELSVDAYGAVVGVFRSHELVLQPGRQNVKLWIPSIEVPYGQFVQVGVRARFVDRDGNVALEGVFQRRIPTVPHHAFVVTVVGDATSSELTTVFDFRPALRPSDLLRHPAGGGAAAAVQFETVDPRRFPAAPVLLTGSDIVVVPAPAYGALAERRWAALDQWVRAGGAALLIVDPTREDFEPDRLRALLDAEGVRLPAVDRGTLPQAEREGGNRNESEAVGVAVCLRRGFGRLVVVFGPGDAWSWKDLIEEVAYLWRLVDLPRTPRVRELPKPTAGDREAPDTSDERTGASERTAIMRSWQRIAPRIHARTRYTSALVSASPEPIENVVEATVSSLPSFPTSWLVGIGLAFVLWIGPCEYLLTRRGMRRWVRWTFPAMSLLATTAIVGLARGYFRDTLPEVHWVITDIDETGRVARTNELSAYFPLRTTVRRREVAGELLSPPRDISSVQFPFMPPWRRPKAQAPPVTMGRFPLRYAQEFTLRQWSPAGQRRLALGRLGPIDSGPSESSSAAVRRRRQTEALLERVLVVVNGIDGKLVSRAMNDEAAAARLIRLVRSQLPEARCAVVTDRQRVVTLFGRDAGSWFAAFGGQNRWRGPRLSNLALTAEEYRREQALSKFRLFSRCILPADVVSGGPMRWISPCGSLTLEDMSPLVDDAGRVALSIVVFEGRDDPAGRRADVVWTFRRVYQRQSIR